MIKAEDARIRTGKAIRNRAEARVEPIGMKITEKSDKGDMSYSLTGTLKSSYFY